MNIDSKENHINLRKAGKQLFTIGLLLLLTVAGLRAQVSNGALKPDNVVHYVNYNPDNVAMDYTIPSNTTATKLYLMARGADGGAGDEKAGSGVTVEGIVRIGTGINEVPPGSTIRFITGQKGDANPDHGGGGGGSAIAVKPAGSSDWTLLMVAGGGGGAGAKYAGRPARRGEDGSGGIGTDNQKLDNAGENGERGTATASYGGGGAFSGVGNGNGDGGAGYQDNEPTGGQGGVSDHPDGGFGFGGGGAAVSGFVFGIEDSGGGGGGYSGGGGGDTNGGGGGGGSFVNAYWVDAIAKIDNGTTSESKNGYAKYHFFSPEPFYIALQSETGKALVIGNDDDKNNNPIQLGNRGPNILSDLYRRLWYYDDASSQIRLLSNPAKCVHLPYNNTANGSKTVLFDCKDSWGSQKFVIDGDLIRHRGNPNKCLMKKWENHDNGNPLVIGDCGNSSHDRKEFKFMPYSRSAPFYITLKADNAKAMTRKGDPSDLSKNVNIAVENLATGGSNIANQLWYHDESTGMIHLLNKPSKCIHLPYTNTSNGTQLTAHDCNESWNSQKWSIDGDLIRLKSDQSKCLVKRWDANSTNNPGVIWDCSNTSHTRREWVLMPYSDQ